MPRRQVPLQASTADLIERIALFFETEGFSRIGGRIFGRLLLADAPMSLDRLATDVSASKASISTETRSLERRGLLERIGKPGDRRVYYQLAAELPMPTMALRLDRWRRFSRLLEEAPADVARHSPLVRRRLDDTLAAHRFLLAEFGDALERWRRRNETPTPAPRS
ncbi:MAG TPA: MarR family transcriptional regulator [Gemmatimonadales bacterium]|jgi:DNA-binding transcriptional regulator GbsR (MarR family)|nr:MarR family transcriptional regulator [Gemmatimonadales bacterium]